MESLLKNIGNTIVIPADMKMGMECTQKSSMSYTRLSNVSPETLQELQKICDKITIVNGSVYIKAEEINAEKARKIIRILKDNINIKKLR